MKNIEYELVSTLKDFFSIVKLNVSCLVIGVEDNLNFTYLTEISPRDYLRYAYLDLNDKSQRGLINSIGNAKRCIDCLIENVLLSLSIIPNNISRQALVFSSNYLNEWESGVNFNQLRLFSALGLAPSLLLSKTRLLRNKVEHDYKAPTLEEAVQAVELAELLLNSIDGKELHSGCIEISDEVRRKGNEERLTGVRFVQAGDGKFELISYGLPRFRYEFRGDEVEFYYFLRAMFVARNNEGELMRLIKDIIVGMHQDINLDEIRMTLV